MKEYMGSLEHSVTNPAPVITPYRPPAGRETGIGLVILPGGGYAHLAEHEGKGYADFFTEQGITCFVVQYRLAPDGYRYPAMLEDALSAMYTVRKSAGEFGIDPQRIGIIGSSAGGHLAANVMIAHGAFKSSISLRPDFGVLCYPVILMESAHCNVGSRTNLLGDQPSEALIRKVSCEQHVTADTPPCFLWHTAEDPAVPVENSMEFAAALRRNGVPFELHVYQKGAHGLGLRTDLDWGSNCVRWIHGILD